MIYPDKQTIDKYMKNITANGDLVSYRHKNYGPTTSSGNEGRFNVSGQTAFYVASGVACARAEVPNWADRDCYEIQAGTQIYAFDLVQYSMDYDCADLFVISKEDGGYSIPQAFATHLTSMAPVSAILYKSAALYGQEQFGVNLVVLPFTGYELESNFFGKQKEY